MKWKKNCELKFQASWMKQLYMNAFSSYFDFPGHYGLNYEAF